MNLSQLNPINQFTLHKNIFCGTLSDTYRGSPTLKQCSQLGLQLDCATFLQEPLRSWCLRKAVTNSNRSYDHRLKLSAQLLPVCDVFITILIHSNVIRVCVYPLTRQDWMCTILQHYSLTVRRVADNAQINFKKLYMDWCILIDNIDAVTI